MSFFSASQISAGYDQTHVIRDVSFELDEGCLMGILGANGSGKTTLLKAICGILPHGGSCILEEMVLEQLNTRDMARNCSYIPQRSGISIDISVLDVVLMGFNPRLGLLEHPSQVMRQRAMEALTQVGLAGKERENYLHLSEGQKQLCILARTLVSDSKLLLLDEPESALDFQHRYRMLEILRQWISQRHIAAITTLHDPGLALNYCDTLLLLGEGKILGKIAPETDSLETMEGMLSRVYGPISLQRVQTRSGKGRLVMLKEDEA